MRTALIGNWHSNWLVGLLRLSLASGLSFKDCCFPVASALFKEASHVPFLFGPCCTGPVCLARRQPAGGQGEIAAHPESRYPAASHDGFSGHLALDLLQGRTGQGRRVSCLLQGQRRNVLPAVARQ